ncbi:MAG: alpha-galactosidase, partial [Streptomyces sp.]|uniref:alpha-galactosidase n=1 Tax=Streptomyces sp. TaxID=1931 RepID=UPI0025FC29D6
MDVTSRGSGLRLALSWSDDEPATVSLRGPGQADLSPATAPLVEALAAGHGREWAGRRFVDTAIGRRLRHRAHRVERRGPWQTASLTQYDDVTGLEFTAELTIHDEELGLRGRTHTRNVGAQPVTLHAVSSLTFGDFGTPKPTALDQWSLLRGRSDWLAEGRFERVPLRAAGLPDLHVEGKPFRTRGCIEAVSLSSWPTAYEMPVGVLIDPAGPQWSFQVEHNGGWVWQLGERPESLYLALLGPTDEHHQWQLELRPGETFSSAPASICVEPACAPLALPALTSFRRASAPATLREPSAVIFNDYMNTVMGDPTANALYPLIDAAAQAGADYFVIDAGWYADDGDWWETVGEWLPSPRRFPDGLDRVLEHVRRRGLVPGLW